MTKSKMFASISLFMLIICVLATLWVKYSIYDQKLPNFKSYGYALIFFSVIGLISMIISTMTSGKNNTKKGLDTLASVTMIIVIALYLVIGFLIVNTFMEKPIIKVDDSLVKLYTKLEIIVPYVSIIPAALCGYTIRADKK